VPGGDGRHLKVFLQLEERAIALPAPRCLATLRTGLLRVQVHEVERQLEVTAEAFAERSVRVRSGPPAPMMYVGDFQTDAEPRIEKEVEQRHRIWAA